MTISRILPLVSICIPNRNMARYLPSSIGSSLEQTYSNIEIIIVDNCSSDDSYEIITGIANSESQCAVFQNMRNIGIPGNWNRCVELSKGEYVVLLSADDTLEPDFVERCMNYHLRFDNLGYVCTEWSTLDEQGNKTFREPFYSKSGVVPAYEEARLNIIGSHTVPSAMLIHKGRLLEVGGYNDRYHWTIDLDLKLKLNLRYDTGYIKDLLCNYREHSGQSIAAGAKSKLLLMELYKTKIEILDNLPENMLGLNDFRKTMQSNMAKSAIDFCYICLDTGDSELALEYLYLAKSFDLNADANPRFKELWLKIGQPVMIERAEEVDPAGTGLPVWPYELPPGSLELEL